MFIDFRSERASGGVGELGVRRWALVRAERGLVREGDTRTRRWSLRICTGVQYHNGWPFSIVFLATAKSLARNEIQGGTGTGFQSGFAEPMMTRSARNFTKGSSTKISCSESMVWGT